MAKEETRRGNYDSKIRRTTQWKFDRYQSELNRISRANQQPVFGPKMQIKLKIGSGLKF